MPRVARYAVALLNGTWQTNGPVSGPFNSADCSLRRVWNTTRCRHGFGPDWTASYQMLAFRKPEPTVAGDYHATSDAPGVLSNTPVSLDCLINFSHAANGEEHKNLTSVVWNCPTTYYSKTLLHTIKEQWYICACLLSITWSWRLQCLNTETVKLV